MSRWFFLCVLGLCVSYFPPSLRAEVFITRWDCVVVGSDYSNAGDFSCKPTYANDGQGGHLGGGTTLSGGGGGALASANQGDLTVAPRDANTKDSCGQVGDPVVISTGNRIEPETDFAGAGEMGLALTRTYDHYWNGIGIFGRRWISNFDYKLLFTTPDPTSSCYPVPSSTPCDPLNKPIWAQRADGRQIKFNYSTSPTPGWYEDKPSPVAKILQTGSTYTLYSEDQTVEVYDANGFPVSIKNPQNVGLTFTYDSVHNLTRVTHSSGRHVDFTWDHGWLRQVTDPAGNVYQYTFTTILTPITQFGGTQPPGTSNWKVDAVVLTGVTLPATSGGAPATTVTYQYENTQYVTALTGKTINGSRFATFQYDANGRSTDTQMANGAGHYHLDYALDGNGIVTGTTVVNPLGKQATYSFDARGNQTGISGLASTHCAAAARAATFDANGYPQGSTDFNGNLTLYSYAANGQLQQQVEAYGKPEARTTDFEWDASNRATKVTVEGDHETTYAYDGNNRLQSVTVKNLSSKVSATAGTTRVTTYSYTTWPSGLVATMTVDGPLAGTSDAVTSSFSQEGDLLSVKDAAGHTTSYDGYNGLGLPGAITGPNGDRRSFTYDTRGRIMVMRTYRNGGTQDTHYDYDSFGRLARITQPDGQTHSYQYDVAGRMTAEFSPESGGTFAETTYQYNGMSLPTVIRKQRVYVQPAQGTVP
ncbi:DUF6531 domain-containing protein [Luteibacter sp. CQ10]|uniref:DUF6531 domain-containing protein n=1 Tax=Luteibacter sp. CQ10 TaxID=2805821 RepID=UPI0034A2E7E2